MDETLLEQERRLRRRSERVVIRQQRARLLPRILEFAGLSIHDVVNAGAAKARVLRLYLVADECEWETRRTLLAERLAFEAFVRANR